MIDEIVTTFLFPLESLNMAILCVFRPVLVRSHKLVGTRKLKNTEFAVDEDSLSS